MERDEKEEVKRERTSSDFEHVEEDDSSCDSVSSLDTDHDHDDPDRPG